MVLPVRKNRIKQPHSLCRQQSNGGDHCSDTPGGESPSRKADEEDLVPLHVILRHETVGLPNVFGQAGAGAPTIDMIPPGALGAKAGLVIDDLWNFILGFREQGPSDSSYIRRGLQMAIAGEVVVFHKSIVAVLIKRVSAAAGISGLKMKIPSRCLS